MGCKQRWCGRTRGQRHRLHRSGGDAKATARGGVLGTRVEPASGETQVPLLEATAEPENCAIEDDSGQAKGIEDRKETFRQLAIEVAESVVEAAVEQGTSAIVGIQATAVRQSTVANGERPHDGGSTWTEGGKTAGARDGAGAGTLEGNGMDSPGPLPVVPRMPLETVTTVGDAAAGGAAATATGGGVDEVFGGGVEATSGETPMRRLEAMVAQGVSAIEANGIQARAIEEPIAEAFEMTLGKVEPSVPAEGEADTPKPVPAVDAAEGAGRQEVLEGGGEKTEGAAAVSGGNTVRALKVSRVDYLETCTASAHHLAVCSTADEFVVSMHLA